MPIDIIPKELYPLVPQVAGVPAVLRGGAQLLDTMTLGFLGVGDIANSILGSESVQWGVFNESGETIAEYDSFLAVSYRDDSRVSDYPIENGSFAAYNKVDQPFGARVTLTCTGDTDKRQAFQEALKAARRSLDLYTVITEDGTFTNCNLVAIDWERRSERGAHRIDALCEFQEIRQRGTTAFSKPAIPSGFSLQNMGQQILGELNIDVSGLV